MLILGAVTTKCKRKPYAVGVFHFNYTLIKVSFQEIWKYSFSEVRETFCGTQDF